MAGSVMDFVHDDAGTHRVTGRRPPTADEEEDDILFADEPDDDEDDGLPLAEDGDEDEPEADPLDDPEPEPAPKAARQRQPDPDTARLVREAQQQREQFTRLQAEIAQERLFKAQAELSAVKSHGALVASQYEDTKRQYQEAVELGETGKLTELQERLNDLRHQQRQINEFTQTRERQLQNPASFVPQPQQAPPEAPKPNPLAMEWAKKNKWFGNTQNQRHAALTGAAYALDKVLIDQGYNPHDPQFYKELDKRLRETMNANVRKQRQTIAGVSSRQAAPQRQGVRKLTAREKAMAAKLNVAESDYAQYVDM